MLFPYCCPRINMLVHSKDYDMVTLVIDQYMDYMKKVYILPTVVSTNKDFCPHIYICMYMRTYPYMWSHSCALMWQ